MSNPLHILGVNTHDGVGGAARVAYGLHQALRKAGHDSVLAVKYRDTADDRVVEWWGGRRSLAREALAHLEKGISLPYYLVPPGIMSDDNWVHGVDIIHLHNIHGGFVNLGIMPRLSHRIPIVWTLHDMWAITANCVHSHDCERWLTGCGSCPRLADHPTLRRDTTRLLWRLKRAIYRRSKLTIVTPSAWLLRLTQKSILGDQDLRHIPNGVDTQWFTPGDQAAARRRLRLPLERPLVLFVASGGSANVFKGYPFLAAALPGVQGHRPLVAIAGGGGGGVSRDGEREVVDLGYVEAGRLRDCYRAADVLAFPSVAENCPLVVLEAMACACPVVAFRTGGIPDLISHMETGYLARAGAADDLAHGLSLVLTGGAGAAGWGPAARRSAERKFSMDKQVAEYIRLYSELAGG